MSRTWPDWGASVLAASLKVLEMSVAPSFTRLVFFLRCCCLCANVSDWSSNKTRKTSRGNSVFLRCHCESTHSRHESLSFNANVLSSCLKLFLLHGNSSFARPQWVTRSLPIWSRKPRRPHASCGTLLRSQTGTDQTNLSLVRKITAFLNQWCGGLDSAAVFLSL